MINDLPGHESTHWEKLWKVDIQSCEYAMWSTSHSSLKWNINLNKNKNRIEKNVQKPNRRAPNLKKKLNFFISMGEIKVEVWFKTTVLNESKKL